MNTVYLYGALGRRFGFRHHFDVASPAEAVRALMANFKNFQSYMISHSTPGYQVFIGHDPIPGVEGLQYPAGRQCIKIVPVIAGAKEAWIRIVIGVVIVAAAIASGQFEFLPVAFGVTAGTAASINIAAGAMGAGLIIGGISQVLMGTPKSPDINNSERPANRPSFLFNGAVNTTAQGHPVPVGYGRMRVGSAVISAGIATEDIAP